MIAWGEIIGIWVVITWLKIFGAIHKWKLKITHLRTSGGDIWVGSAKCNTNLNWDTSCMYTNRCQEGIMQIFVPGYDTPPLDRQQRQVGSPVSPMVWCLKMTWTQFS